LSGTSFATEMPLTQNAAALQGGQPHAIPATVSHCTTSVQSTQNVEHCLAITKGKAQQKTPRATPSTLAKSMQGSKFSVPPKAAAAKPQDIAASCSQGFSNPDRFTSCSIELWTITETETTNGVTTVVGEFPIQISSSASFAIESGLDWILSAAVFGDVPTGTLAAGLHGTMETGCRANANVCQTTGTDGQPIAITENSSSFGDWEQQDIGQAATRANAIDTMDGFLGVVLDVTGSFGESIEIADSSVNTLSGRCDSIITPTECVDQFGPMAVAFDATLKPLIGPVAQHVWDSEATNAPAPLPTRWGNPFFANTGLTRDMSTKDQNANNTAACASLPVQSGQNCDEFPMASTHQGAAFVGPGNFSARAVPTSANNSQGGVLSVFYSEFHVLDGDEFFVQAVLANGTLAWI
jgi:hypothetical protein